MFDDRNYSPNGFNVHKYENENVNEFDITIRGSMFGNKNDPYPDYQERQRLQQEVQITPVETKWDVETRESQRKLNEIKAQDPGVLINRSEEVMDPNAFFNNSSQIYLLYTIGDKMKK